MARLCSEVDMHWLLVFNHVRLLFLWLSCRRFRGRGLPANITFASI